MQVIMKILNGKQLDKIIDLPVDWKHRKVEVLILPVDEVEKSDKVFHPQEYRGILKIENVEDEINLIRNEWERI